MRYPEQLDSLFRFLQKLPGVGKRTSERYGFELLHGFSHAERENFCHAIKHLDAVTFCKTCGAIEEKECHFCADSKRRQDQLCIVGSCREVYSIEKTKEYEGLYHVLDGLLSPLDGRSEEVLGIERLIRRLQDKKIQEVVLALDSSIEGDATCLYLREALLQFNVTISRLAFGIPVGSSLEYVDGGTLARAFSSRGIF